MEFSVRLQTPLQTAFFFCIVPSRSPSPSQGSFQLSGVASVIQNAQARHLPDLGEKPPLPPPPKAGDPHVLSGWRHKLGSPSRSNVLSASLLDDFLWNAMMPFVNELRSAVRLRTLRIGASGGTQLADHKVPVSHLWSPALAPRPDDWPAHVGVTGFCFWEEHVPRPPAPADEAALRAWLSEGTPPVLVCFGSMGASARLDPPTFGQCLARSHCVS